MVSNSVATRDDPAGEVVRRALEMWLPASALLAEVRPDTPLAGLGIDARTWVSFAYALRLGSSGRVLIDDSHVGSLTTVRDVLDHVRAHHDQ